MQVLRIIGYDTRDSIAAIKAFKLHFVQNDSTPILNDADRKIIYDLYKKYWFAAALIKNDFRSLVLIIYAKVKQPHRGDILVEWCWLSGIQAA